MGIFVKVEVGVRIGEHVFVDDVVVLNPLEFETIVAFMSLK